MPQHFMKHHFLKKIIAVSIAVLTTSTTFSMYGDEKATLWGSDRITVDGIVYYINIEGHGASAYISYVDCLGPTSGNNTQIVTIQPSVSCYYSYWIKDENGQEYTVTRGLTGTVTTVGGQFKNNGNIKSVFIPTTVTKITQDAFSYCENLTSINIPNSVRSIGTFAFGYCINLPEITLPNSLDSVGHSVFFNCRKLSSITIPSSLKYISYAMFNSCVSLKEVNFPPTLTHIFNQAFERCHPLSDLALPESVTYIGNEAFQDCHRINCITIPENVTTIGENVFYDAYVDNINKVIWKARNCTLVSTENNSPFHEQANINSLIIGPEVEAITGKMFYNYQSIWSGVNTCIYSIISQATVPPRIDENCFTPKCYLYATLKVPYESIEAYREADAWKNFSNIVGYHFGDVDGDDRISIADVIELVDIIIAGNGEDNPIADTDGDGVISIGDIVKLIDIILEK